MTPNIFVPKPQVYILHKIIINDKRGKKQDKDILAIKRGIDVISTYKDEDIELKRKTKSGSVFKKLKYIGI